MDESGVSVYDLQLQLLACASNNNKEVYKLTKILNRVRLTVSLVMLL